MVASFPSLSRSLVAAGGRDTVTSLCARRGARSSLKAHLRSFSLLAGGHSPQIAATTSAGSPAAGARTTTTTTPPPAILIIGGAVGGAVVLVVVLALVYVLQVRRKVERLRRSTNVLGPELTPIPRPADGASIDVAVQVTPRLASVPAPDHQRHHYLSGTPSITSPIGPLRGPISPARRSTIDVDASRAIQHTSPRSAGPLTPTRSPYELVPIGPPRSPLLSPARKLTIDIDDSRAIRHTSRPSAGPWSPARSPYEMVARSVVPASFPRTPPQRSARPNDDGV